MSEERRIFEHMAAQLAEVLDLIEQTRQDVKEMHRSMDRIEAHCRRIEGHCRRIDEILQQSLSRGVGGREAG